MFEECRAFVALACVFVVRQALTLLARLPLSQHACARTYRAATPCLEALELLFGLLSQEYPWRAWRRHRHAPSPVPPPRCLPAAPYIATRWLLPPLVPPPAPPPGEPTSAVLYVHGGAFVSHMPSEHACAAQLLPLLHGRPPLLSVAYSLSPEAGHGQQCDQVIEALSWLVDAVGCTSVALVGDSAGGNLALCAALHLGELGPTQRSSRLRRALCSLTLISPWMPNQADGRAASTGVRTDYLSPIALATPARAYLENGGPTREHLLRLVAADALALPPTLVISSTGENMAHHAASLAAAAPERIALHMAEGEAHVFPCLPWMLVRRGAAATSAWRAAAAHINAARALKT